MAGHHGRIRRRVSNFGDARPLLLFGLASRLSIHPLLVCGVDTKSYKVVQVAAFPACGGIFVQFGGEMTVTMTPPHSRHQTPQPGVLSSADSRSTVAILTRQIQQLSSGIGYRNRLLASAHGRPRVTSHTKGSGLSTCKASACTVLKEKRATIPHSKAHNPVWRRSGPHGGEPICKGDAQIHHGDGQKST